MAVPPPIPPFVALVNGSAGEREKIRLIAVRSGVEEEHVERAFGNGRAWVLAFGVSAATSRAVRLGERMGWSPRSVQTAVPNPNFIAAMVLGGVAQAPAWISSGVILLDTAVAAGLGVTAVASLIRQVRRVKPAREAVSAASAWEEFHRAPRRVRATDELLRLEAALWGMSVPANVRVHAYEALEEAWFRALRGGGELEAGAAAEVGALLEGDERALHAAVSRLKLGS